MAELEFAGIKFKGGRMVAVATGLTTLVGGLYGGFEVYKDYMDMKEMIQSYVAPDLSGFQEQLSVIREELNSVKDVSAAQVEIIAVYGDKIDFMQNGIALNEAANRDMKNDIRNDINRIESIVDKVEDDLQEIEIDMKEMIDVAEQRFDTKRDQLYADTDRQIRQLEERLNTRIQEALDNPLAN